MAGMPARAPAQSLSPRSSTSLDINAQHCRLNLQAVAIGAALQAGVYDGLVSGLMVLDIWQATLMRAFATQRLGKGAADGELESEE
jgi:hypothetical protein